MAAVKSARACTVISRARDAEPSSIIDELNKVKALVFSELCEARRLYHTYTSCTPDEAWADHCYARMLELNKLVDEMGWKAEYRKFRSEPTI